MGLKERINSKWITVAIIVIIAILAAIPTLFKLISDDFGWDDVAEKIGIVGDARLDDYPVNFHVVDVGQGSCTLVTSDYGTIMIDCGERDQKDNVEGYLNNLGIKRIDYLIATHPHSDHIGCMYSIVNKFEIGKFYMPKLDKNDIPTSSCYEYLLESLDGKNVDSSYIKGGDSFTLGEIRCTALAPVKTIKGNLNSMSVILKIEYGNTSFLVTGDAETDEEKTVLQSGADLSSDVICLGHHGSRTSSSSAFLKAVDPHIAVISCAADNKYGHPHQETLDKLEKLGIKYYRTDIDSTVIFSSDGKRIIDHQRGETDD